LRFNIEIIQQGHYGHYGSQKMIWPWKFGVVRFIYAFEMLHSARWPSSESLHSHQPFWWGLSWLWQLWGWIPRFLGSRFEISFESMKTPRIDRTFLLPSTVSPPCY
jgi:hypothetical protein